MKNILTLTAIICLALSFQSCKKDKDSDSNPTPPAKVCRLAAATITTPSGSGTTYSFSYNNDEKISQIILSGSPLVTATFTYSGNAINVVRKSGATITSKIVITTNAAGLILHSEDRDLNTDTVDSYSDYEYTNSGELTKVTQNYGSSEPNISNCSYSNGNLVTLSNSGTVSSFDYYTDQSFRIGDYLRFLQFIDTGNAFFIVNKNLVKSQTDGDYISNFNYTFDTDNNITQLDIINGAEITSVAFQQICE